MNSQDNENQGMAQAPAEAAPSNPSPKALEGASVYPPLPWSAYQTEDVPNVWYVGEEKTLYTREAAVCYGAGSEEQARATADFIVQAVNSYASRSVKAAEGPTKPSDDSPLPWIQNSKSPTFIADANGNTVGRFALSEDAAFMVARLSSMGGMERALEGMVELCALLADNSRDRIDVSSDPRISAARSALKGGA